MYPQSLSIFFPMYNERMNIEQVIAKAEDVISKFGFKEYEILFIDDGSRDGCAELVKSWAEQNPHIRLVRHPHNMGYGVALRTGFTSAIHEAVFYTDCDLPADLAELRGALPMLQNADLVIGYRIRRYETTRRAIYSRIYNLLMRILFNVHVRDVNFSFKLVRKEVLERISLNAETVFIDGQLLAEATRYGFKIVEIPIDYTPRRFGKSNFDSLRAAWTTFIEMTTYYIKSSFSRHVAIERDPSPDQVS